MVAAGIVVGVSFADISIAQLPPLGLNGLAQFIEQLRVPPGQHLN
jgi:hypothetical protein